MVVFIDACFVFLLINLLSGTYRPRDIPLGFWFTIAICAYLLVVSVFFHPKDSHFRWMGHMVRMLVIAFAIHCLSLKKYNTWMPLLLFAMLSLAVCWQSVAYYFFDMPNGTFSKSHYLTSFAILVLPVIAYLFLATKGWYKYLLIVVALLDMDLILKIPSRPAVLGITVGALFVLIFLTKGRLKWGGLLVLCAVLSGGLITNYGDLYTRFEELIVNLAHEERIQIWSDSWTLLKENSLTTWIFGNGIGVFRTVYPKLFTPVPGGTINFPHLHGLEILYDSGVIAVILVFSGIAFLLIYAIKAAKQAGNVKSRILVKCLIVAFIGWLIHTGFTLPFYSKYTQYSLAFILGTLLSIIAYPADRKDEQTKS
ncbi:MAG: O-antigen ligase family protein [Desulfobacterales bacterium]